MQPNDTGDTMIALLILLAIIGIAQLTLSYYIMREVGEIDGDRRDWWETLREGWEPAKRLDDSIRRLRGEERPK